MNYQDCIDKLKFAAETDLILAMTALKVLNTYFTGKEDTILGKYNKIMKMETEEVST